MPGWHDGRRLWPWLRPCSQVRRSAQQAQMSEDLAWKLLELGRVIDPPKTAALYAPMQEKEPYQGVKVERDVKYGAGRPSICSISSCRRRIRPRGRC